MLNTQFKYLGLAFDSGSMAIFKSIQVFTVFYVYFDFDPCLSSVKSKSFAFEDCIRVEKSGITLSIFMYMHRKKSFSAGLSNLSGKKKKRRIK